MPHFDFKIFWGGPRPLAQVTTEQGATGDYKLELKAARGGGVLALDDVSVDLVPLVGEQYVREEEGESSTGGQQEEGRN